MTFWEYSDFAATTDIHGNTPDLTYCIVALAGEVGELANKWKKILRGDKALDAPGVSDEILHEIGDVLWYLARFSEPFGGLDDAARMNRAKLISRRERGAIKGDGDHR